MCRYLAALILCASASATELEWQAPTTCTDGTPLAAVDYYTVYRERMPIAEVQGTSYVDAYEPAPGETVCYEITATGGCGGGSAGQSYYSNRGCVTGGDEGPPPDVRPNPPVLDEAFLAWSGGMSRLLIGGTVSQPPPGGGAATLAATGATATYDLDGYRYFEIDSDLDFIVTTAGDVEIMAIGGGASGGNSSAHGAGGGGAGQMVEHSTTIGTGTYPAVIGAGGAVPAFREAGVNGGSTTFNGLTAIGGGGGGSERDPGLAGGSGGGAFRSGAAGGATSYSGSGTGYGNAGGLGQSLGGGDSLGGGGGGAGAVGEAPVPNTSAGDGGDGRTWLDGNTYGGGGGGAMGTANGVSGDGGAGGGGDGGGNDRTPTAGSANTGAGGGGTGQNGVPGAGGSGAIRIRTPL